MNKNLKIFSVSLCAAMLLSGCSGSDKPAAAETTPAATTAAPETEAVTTTAEVTTTTAGTTSTAVTTTVEPVKEPASISLLSHSDDRDLCDSYIYPPYGHYHTEPGEHEEINLTMYANEDHVEMLNFTLDDSAMTVEEDQGRTILTADAAASNLKVRPSVCAISDDSDNDINLRINMSMFTDVGKFGSAYEISYDDPQLVVIPYVKTVDDSEDYNRRFKDPRDVTLGYTIAAPVTVNAFVCDGENGLSILVDPEYMHGLPLFSLGDTYYSFGKTRVVSDSLFFTGAPVEGLALDTADYAYAKVKLLDTHVVYSKQTGYSNTCTVSDIEIIKEFSDFSELDITNDTDIMSGEDKDPAMLAIYNTIMDAKDEIMTDKTRGIVLLDLDFDGTPELLVTKLHGGEGPYFDTEVYRIADDGSKLIDKLHPAYRFAEGFGTYLGLSKLKDGTPAWFMTKAVNTADEYGFSGDTEDYLYTLDGDTINEYPLFTKKEISPATEDADGNFTEAVIDYYFYGEKIVPTVTMGRDPYSNSEDDPLDWEYMSWNGISATYGMWELFGFARADFCESITESYPLLSDWIVGSDSFGSMTEPYDITDREFAHSIAYMVDDWFYGRSNGVEHNYWFLGAYAKPVIYLYPEEKTDVSVQVNFTYGGELTCTYPDYGDGWNVTAMPDGTLYDADGNEYYCLYWEGDGAADFDMSRGFCVAGSDTAAFLREKLMYIGLTAREANEFIIYWLPKMQGNPYNLITLHTADYAASVPLDVSPEPDTQIRVFMTYYTSDTPVDIPEQTLPHYERNGFTLVEWGGSEG